MLHRRASDARAMRRRTGFAAVDAVIDRVNSLGGTPCTPPIMTSSRRFGDVMTPVRASQSGVSRRSLTIGDVRYLIDGSSTRACTVSTGDCIDTIDASRVSDVQMTPDFFGTESVCSGSATTPRSPPESRRPRPRRSAARRRRARRSRWRPRRTRTACSTTACSPVSMPATSSSR